MRKDIFVYEEGNKFFAVRAGFPSQSVSLEMALRDLRFTEAEEVRADSLEDACQRAADVHQTKAIGIEVYRPADEGGPVDPSFREGRFLGVSAIPRGMLDAGVFADYRHQCPVVSDIPLARELIARYTERGRVPHGQQRYSHERYILNVAFVSFATGNEGRAEGIVGFYRKLDSGNAEAGTRHRAAADQAQREYDEATRATIRELGYDDPNFAAERARRASSRYLELLGL